ASIDAASPRRTLFRITLPLLAPNLLVVFILLMIKSVQIFDEAWVLTNGGGQSEEAKIAAECHLVDILDDEAVGRAG
ncbi:hypothetical protein ACC785_39230, partial [Rhizobium ruizarguesonis]